MQNGATFGVGDHQFHGADRKALTDTAAAIDLLVLTRGEGNLFHDGANVPRNLGLHQAAFSPGLLTGDGDAFDQRQRIVGANLRSDAILQRRYDFAARRVVLRIGAEDQRHVESQADRIPFDLHIPFLHDVEQRDLDLAREIG